MILIADGGSTKTEWVVTENGKEIQRILTKGMNPYLQSEDDISAEVKTVLLPELKASTLDALYFYGAGCAPQFIPMMQQTFEKAFENVKKVEVYSDMLGACRGLSGKNPGIVCIIGTGSNSCYYDGEAIVTNVSPLGFILGDDGSGSALGKQLVGDLLKNQMPEGLKEKFLEQHDLTAPVIIERVYRQPFPNRFLAGFAPFIYQNLNVPEVRALALNGFKSFLNRNVKQYDYHQNKVHFVGSIAFYFQELLQEAIKDCGMQMGTILKSPMDGLIEYHA